MRNVWFLFLVGMSTGLFSEKHFVTSQTTFATTDDLYLEGHTSGDLPIDDEDAENDGSGSGSGDYGIIDLAEKDEHLYRFLNISKSTEEMQPLQPQPTTVSTHIIHTTAVVTQETTNKVKDAVTTAVISPDANEDKVSVIIPKAEPTTQKPRPSTAVTPSRKTTTASVTLEPNADNSLDRWNVAPTKEEILIKQVDNDIETRAEQGGRLLNMAHEKDVTSENLWERTEVLAAVIACGVVGFLCAVFLLLLLAYRMKKKDEGSYDLGDTKLTSTAYQKAPTKEFYA
ncbi:syndecan-2-B-like [Gouania willdenowi]|uniref:Syndecan n=1 Tax=Gouania willdenowi TaxID=441366 RepID=A0A8C5GYV3_GOUWI|nr:syndecan-2-B-like [Gouania willdenowi]